MASSTLLTRVKTLLDSNTATDSATLCRDKNTYIHAHDARKTELTKNYYSAFHTNTHTRAESYSIMPSYNMCIDTV